MLKRSNLKFSYAISLAMQLGFLTVASVGGFLFLGIWLDTRLGTSPFLLILGIIIGITMTIIESHRLIKPLITPDREE